MTSGAKSIGTIPCLLYRDAPAAIDWLCRVFGFERHFVVPGEAGKIAHAQLSFGTGMVMLGSANGEGEYHRYIKQPADLGGLESQTVCLVVTDADAIYLTAKAHGAEILIDIRDEDYGGRAFICRDLEGHIWTIGTYNPWRIETAIGSNTG